MADPVVWLDEVDSTNDEAKRRAAAGEQGPLWIAARRQSSGRGRRARPWTSADGNLFCTLLMRVDAPPAAAAQLGFAAGLAVAETADGWADPGAVRLKWPNDVLLNGAKTAGCLLESGVDAGGRWLAVGIGLNLVSAPPDTPFPATHLSAHLNAPAAAPTPQSALQRLAPAFGRWRDRWARDGFAPLRDAFLARAAALGEPIVARLADGSEQRGVFEDLDGEGALILRDAHGGRRAITAADVYFALSGQG